MAAAGKTKRGRTTAGDTLSACPPKKVVKPTAGPASSPRTFVQSLATDLTLVAALLAQYAEADAERREAAASRTLTARQLAGLIAARHARSAAFGFDLANPGWSLLLELYLARLEARPARPARLATDARVAATTMKRWLDLFVAAGLATRTRARGRPAARPAPVALALTDAGAEAMRDYFEAAALGWTTEP